MITKNCKSEIEWVQQINSWLESQVAAFKAQSLFLPAGETPRPLYQNWEAQHPLYLRGVRFLQVDDVLDAHAVNKRRQSVAAPVLGDQRLENPRMFARFFRECLPSYQDQMVYIDKAEQSADLAILGLGLNGHVAFHEPRLSENFYSGCLRLDDETVNRLGMPTGTYGVSYGLAAFMRAKAIALIVRGENKRSILREILSEECHLPAAKLKSHANLSIFVV